MCCSLNSVLVLLVFAVVLAKRQRLIQVVRVAQSSSKSPVPPHSYYPDACAAHGGYLRRGRSAPNKNRSEWRWMSYVRMRAERWSAESCMSLCLFFRLVTCADPERGALDQWATVGL